MFHDTPSLCIFQTLMTSLSFPMTLKFGWYKERLGSVLQGSWKFTCGGHGDQCVTWGALMLTQHADSLATQNQLIMTQVIPSKCAVLRSSPLPYPILHLLSPYSAILWARVIKWMTFTAIPVSHVLGAALIIATLIMLHAAFPTHMSLVVSRKIRAPGLPINGIFLLQHLTSQMKVYMAVEMKMFVLVSIKDRETDIHTYRHRQTWIFQLVVTLLFFQCRLS